MGRLCPCEPAHPHPNRSDGCRRHAAEPCQLTLTLLSQAALLCHGRAELPVLTGYAVGSRQPVTQRRPPSARLVCMQPTWRRMTAGCGRPSLDAVIELLALLPPILADADPRLAAHVAASGVPPFFALSLFITWFAHNLPCLGEAARLFDLFIASHPLMPLYAAVAVLKVRGACFGRALDPVGWRPLS